MRAMNASDGDTQGAKMWVEGRQDGDQLLLSPLLRLDQKENKGRKRDMNGVPLPLQTHRRH